MGPDKITTAIIFLLKDAESQVGGQENIQGDKFQEMLVKENLEAAKRREKNTYNSI